MQLESPKLLKDLSSSELKFVQEKLSKLGYYPSNMVDGIHGTKTAKAWEEFKKDNYQADPLIIGKGSLKILIEEIKELNQPNPIINYSPKDLDILTRTVIGEARGESQDGQIAVTWVIINRALHSQSSNGFWWGTGIEGVCLAPYQFSCWNVNDPNRQYISNLDSNSSLYLQIKQVVEKVLNGFSPDPTGDADHYHTTTIRPKWANGVSPTVKIDSHLFYRLNFKGKRGSGYDPLNIAVKCRFSMNLKQSNNLLTGHFDLIDKNDKLIHRLVATSGARGWQTHSAFKSRGKGPCPPFNGLTINTKGYHLPTRGIEGMFFHITPDPIPNFGRGEIGLHWDANVPGTAGCIGIIDRKSFNNIVVPAMKKAFDAGVKQLPLDIIYT